MKLTLDNHTTAALPGKLQISKSKFLDYRQLSGLKRAKYAALLSLPPNTLYNLGKSDDIIIDYVQKAEQFLYGCLNPTVVVHKEKGIIATFTDLSLSGDKPSPVIKISAEPLQLITNMAIQNGQRLPSIAIYERNLQHQYASSWADFHPKIANCFTDDIAACNKLLSTVKDAAWECLRIGMEQIEDCEKLGLYKVKVDEALVANAYKY